MFVEIQNGKGVANDAFIVKIKPVLKKDVKGLEDRLMEMYSLEDIHFMGFKIGGGGKPVDMENKFIDDGVRVTVTKAQANPEMVVEDYGRWFEVLKKGELMNRYVRVPKSGRGMTEAMSDENGLYFLPDSRWNEVLMYKVEMSDGSAEYMSEQEYADFKYKTIGFKEA